MARIVHASFITVVQKLEFNLFMKLSPSGGSSTKPYITHTHSAHVFVPAYTFTSVSVFSTHTFQHANTSELPKDGATNLSLIFSTAQLAQAHNLLWVFFLMGLWKRRKCNRKDFLFNLAV